MGGNGERGRVQSGDTRAAADADGRAPVAMLRSATPAPAVLGHAAAAAQARNAAASQTPDAAAALQASESRYQAVLEHSPGLILTLRRSGEITHANHAAEQSLEAEAGHLRGRKLWELVTPASQADLARYLDRLATEGTARGILCLRARSGEERVWACNSLAAPGEDAPASVYLYGLDITDLTRMEEAVRASEDRYHRSLNRATDGIWIFDRDAHCLYANDAACTLLRRPREEILGVAFWDFVPTTEQAQIRTLFSRLQQRGADRVLAHIAQPEGAAVSIELTAVDLGDGTYQAIGRDMSDWLRTQEQLRASEERYRSVVESPTRAIFLANGEGRIRFHNQEFTRLLGEDGTLIGRDVADFVAVRDRPALRQACDLTHEEPGVALELHLDGPPDAERLLQLTLSWLPASGELLGEAVDVTEQRAMEQRLAQSQRMDSVGNLAAGISHDFNNLLTVVRSTISEAIPAADPASAALLRTAEAAATSAAELSQQLLAIGRATDAVHKAVPLKPQVEELFRLLRRTIHPNTTLVNDVPSDLYVLGSSTQLQHVLINLALNASEAMPAGGRLQICATTLGDVPPPYDLPAREAGYVVLEVGDNGCGMDAETAAHVFEPYFSTKGEKGNGLGLAMVYGIVRQHNGVIAIRSAPQEGTTVQVYLPAAREAEAEPTPPDAAPSVQDAASVSCRTDEDGAGDTGGTAARTPCVLVVDDHNAVRQICEVILHRAHYRVIPAASGQAALDFLAALPAAPDLVLLDSSMPGLSGRETFEAMRARHPQLKVIFMSGFAAETLDGMHPEPTWRFLQKPFDSAGLLKAIADLLGTAASSSAPAGAASV